MVGESVVNGRGLSVRLLAAFAVSLVLFAAMTGASAASRGSAAEEAVSVFAVLQETWGVDPLDVPADARALPELLAAYDAIFELARAPGSLGSLTSLSPELTEVVRDLLSTLLFVQEVRDEEFAGVADSQLAGILESESEDSSALALIANVDEARMRAATLALARAVDRALPVLLAAQAKLPAAPPGVQLPPLIDLAPVLVMDPLGADNLYEKDAVLMIDLGGNDVYDANAGGSMIHRGLVGDPQSCQYQAVGFSIGCENEDSFEAFTASLLIDVAGDDTYGVYKPPRPGSRDAICGPEPIIRRVVTYGSGSGGIGMLVDVAGNDAYHGKTLSIGNGHLAGVGVHFDLTGNDERVAVRSAMGSSVLQGSGFLFDGEGDDTYRFRAPAGGLWNVDRGRCDETERLGLAAGVIQGHATFIDRSGDDVYEIGAQGLGHVEAFAYAQFLDLGGVDDYGGYPNRENNAMVLGAATFLDRD